MRIWDPGSGCLFDPWIQDLGSGMGKNRDPDPGRTTLDHISESLETIFLVKFCDADLGSEIRDAKIRIPDLGWKNSDLRSGIKIPDPQH